MRLTISFLIFSSASFILAQDECDGVRYATELFSDISTTYNIEFGENITEDILGFEYTQTLYLDIYEPESDELTDRPLVIFMFGGAFIGGSKNSPVMVELCTRYAKMGYVAASIDYRITPTLIWNGTAENAYKAVLKAIHDLKAAIRFFRMNDELNDNFKIDTSRIYAGGSSAGAIASINAAYINNSNEIPEEIYDFVIENGGLEGLSGNPGYDSNFNGVINLCGAIGHFDWIVANDIPIVSVHGNEDTIVPYADEAVTLFGINVQVYGSYIIHQTMMELGNQSALYTFEGAGHTPYGSSSEDMNITIEFTRDFMYDLVCDDSQSGEISIQFDTDWNLVGLPVEMEISIVGDLFPSSIENTLFSFDQGYILETSLANGEGYWLRFAEEGTTILTGNLLDEISISLDEGWNLLSGISEDISIYSAIDTENIIVENTLYGFSEGYVNSDILVPGQGYWLRTYEAGEITILSSRWQKPNIKDYSLYHQANSLTVNGLDLYFGTNIHVEDEIHYSLPPKPPLQSNDIRFSGNTKVCDSDECVIEVMNDGQPPMFDWEIKNGEVWEIVDESGNVFECSEFQMIESSKNSETLVLRKSTFPITPEKFSLLFAYPNPFNPITTLSYDLPKGSNVKLAIYDMLGNEVTTLVNTTQQAGFNSVQWDATDSMGKPVSAGVYLYQIQAGDPSLNSGQGFVQTKKIVLLK